MKLTKITLHKFQGAVGPYNYVLTGVDVFCGRNGVGKSRILQAAQLAIAGYVPNALDGTQIEPLEMFSKNAGATKMMVGADIEGGPSIMRTFQITTAGDKKTVKQTITIDGEAQAGMKQAERDFKDQVGEFTVMVDPAVFSRMTMRQRAEFFLSICPSPSVTPAAIAAANGEVLRLARELKSQEEKAQAVAEQMVADPKRSAAPAEAIRAKLEKARKDLQALESAAAGQKSIDPVRASLMAEVGRLTSSVTDAVRRSGLPNGAVATVEEEQKRVVEKLAELPSKATGLLERAEKLDEMRKQYGSAREEFQKISSLRDGLKQVLDDARRSETCPLCDAKLIRVASTFLTRVEGLTVKADELAAVLTAGDMTAEFERVIDKRRDVLERIGKLSQRSSSVSELLTQVQRLSEVEKQLAAMPTATSAGEAKVQIDALKLTVQELDGRLRIATQEEAVIAQAKQWKADAEKKRGELAKAKSELAVLTSKRLSELQETMKGVEAEMVNLFWEAGRRWEARLGFRWTDERGDEAIDIGWWVRRDGDILTEGEAFVNVDNLSESQKAVTLACILPPLIKRRQGEKLKLLIFDNCEIFDRDNRPNFLRALVKAREEGMVDNVLLASSAKYPAAEGVCIQEVLSSGVVDVNADELSGMKP